MVFQGCSLDPMFAAADANDSDLTKEIYEAHGGDDAPPLVKNKVLRVTRLMWNACSRRQTSATARATYSVASASPFRSPRT